MPTKKCQKMQCLYTCDICCFKTRNKYNYDKHLLTPKHSILQNTINLTTPNLANTYRFECSCGKSYIHRSSLYNHKKSCNAQNQIISSDKISTNEITNDVILKLIAENSDIKKMLFKQFETMQEQQKQMNNQISELIPKVGNNNTVTNVKQKFNINIFLNEKCKDALTMNEFINKINVTVDDLIITKNKGISEGVSNIFIENMNKLSVHERPIHCTDVKRETVYIKCDADKEGTGEPYWEKDEQNKKLKTALNKVTYVQNKNLNKWIEQNPNWEDNPDVQDEYMKLIKNCTDDLTENKRDEKIIKKLCNEVYIGSKG